PRSRGLSSSPFARCWVQGGWSRYNGQKGSLITHGCEVSVNDASTRRRNGDDAIGAQALLLEIPKEKRLVSLDGPGKADPILPLREWQFCSGKCVVCVEALIAEKAIHRSVQVIRAAFGQNVEVTSKRSSELG